MHRTRTTLIATGRDRLHDSHSATGDCRTRNGWIRLPCPTSWLHLFTRKRFHVLLNSLFKVLCNFPSRYLFAIGLAVIFCLTSSLPRTLGCTLKQPDSNVPRPAQWARSAMGLTPAMADELPAPVKGTCRAVRLWAKLHHVSPRYQRCTASAPHQTWGLSAGLFPFRSPLLRESLLAFFSSA